jgi:hypothetical protein
VRKIPLQIARYEFRDICVPRLRAVDPAKINPKFANPSSCSSTFSFSNTSSSSSSSSSPSSDCYATESELLDEQMAEVFDYLGLIANRADS